MVRRTPFGALPDGTAIDALTIANDGGLQICAITYGAIVTSLLVPDDDGRQDDVVLGFDGVEQYVGQTSYLGALVGRYANRIARARFSLDGREYRVSENERPNHLHGGYRGFDKHVWAACELQTPEGEGVEFSRVSSDGEEGYPGTLRVAVRYLVTRANEWRIEYAAETDAPTLVNPTQHSYFNLGGRAARDVLGHVLRIDGNAYTPVDQQLLPRGPMAPVAGTPFDFRRERPVGELIDAPDEQLRFGRGYDHNWVLRRGAPGLVPAARLADPASGRVLNLLTTEPGLQFYSGNQLDGSLVGRDGEPYRRHAGLCLETQKFPDSPNQPAFPSAVLRPGRRFVSCTVFRFSTRAGRAVG